MSPPVVDPGLLERARGGDPRALEALLADLAPSISRFGRRMCGHTHDAEDVLQDTLLNVATHLGEVQGAASLRGWVFALTRSACARRRRGLKNRPAAPLDVEPLDAGRGPEERAADRELAAALSTALERLPDEYREVLLLRDVEGLTAPEAAEALGLTLAALKSRLHRARGALREAIGPLVSPAAPPPEPTCPDAASLMSRHLEGELSSVDCAAMEQHVKSCPGCAAACRTLERALGACKRAAAGPVPPEVQAQVKGAVRAWLARAV